MGSTVKQDENYKIGDSTSIGIVLVTLYTSKLQPGYLILEKQNKKNCPLYGFNTETPKSSPFVLLVKDSACIHNYLHAIA